MIFVDQDAKIDPNSELPEPIYDSVVRSLYGDQKTLLVGSMTIVAAPIVLFLRTGDNIQLLFALLLAILGGTRLIDGWMYGRAATEPLTGNEIRHWEMRYAALGAMYVGTLGFWCLVSMAVTSDQFVHLMTIVITISYIVGIIGRNFSSEAVVLSQTVFSGFPMISGFVLFGDIYHQFLGLFLLPFFFTIWLMSRNLRSMLFSAVLTALDNKTIADRFDAALGNVSHGLAMLNREGKFVVLNSPFPSLAGLEPGADLKNRSISALAESSASAERRANERANFGELLGDCLEKGVRTDFMIDLPDGRIVEVKFNPMADDGGVIVLEDITERVSSEEEIRKLASFDPLTHLPNRRFFMSEVNRLLGGVEGLQSCTVFFIDLDNFKDVNDALGHGIGDKLLCSIALRMRAIMPEKAMACRFGGDEFVIVVPGKMQRRECQDFADLLIAEIANPALIDGHNIMIGASIGIAQCPVNGREYAQLLQVSDLALYDAKARGRGSYSFYSDELGDAIRDRRALEHELRRAIKRGQLQVYYQPLIDLNHKRVTTCEALLRWRHPERGMIPPSVFIPVAEEIGMISEIGEFVLREAAAQCLKWPVGVSVAVNVSSLQFQQSDVYRVVETTLEKTGLKPNRLEVEVTESAMLENVAETTAILNRLSQIGVKISLDDFGTGFSSLSYLHALPLDKVKIDRSFIEHIQSDERSLVLLSGVTHLARDLGLSITIEGVETESQRDALISSVHVDQMQGYLFGKAMPANDIARFFDEDIAALVGAA